MDGSPMSFSPSAADGDGDSNSDGVGDIAEQLDYQYHHNNQGGEEDAQARQQQQHPPPLPLLSLTTAIRNLEASYKASEPQHAILSRC